jgi:two component transcriptional regulator, winged helix family
MTTRPLILIVDDETRIRRLVAAHLEKAGFDVCQAQDGAEGLEVFRRSPIEPDLVILDLMMPEMNGHETLRELRTFSDVPVLILTARDLLGDKKLGFTAGADDYLVKPFAFDELELRIRALLRRAAAAADTPGARVIVNGPLTLRSAEHDLLWKGTAVTLTEQEYRLLTALASHPGAVLRYAELIRCGWPGEEGVDVSRLRVAIARIRKKLGSVGINPMILSSFTNVGYLMGDLTDYDEEFGSPAG